MMKALLLAFFCSLALLARSSFAQGDDSLAFDPLNPAFDKYENVVFSFDRALAAMKSRTDVPEILALVTALEQLKEIYNSVDPSSPSVSLDPDTFRSIPEIVKDKGYPAETHRINTEDGYFIEIFRVPHGKNTTAGGKPVLLSHGLIDSAGSWVLNYPHQSLPYLLADAGYDVWLGNVRGNRYGEEHEEHGRYDRKLWAFSYDEQGLHDIPTTLDYIRNATGYPKVAVVGHSQGCTQMFASFYHYPEVADKLSMFVALAPALYFKHNINLLIQSAAHLYLAELLDLVGLNKFVPLNDLTERTLAHVCGIAPKTVEFVLALIMGFNFGEINYDRFSVMCYHMLGMTSVQNMVHWAQMVRTAEFKAHDFGYFKNKEVYGDSKPPKYHLDQIYPKNIPLAVFYGTADLLVSARDTENVIADLPMAPVFTKHIPEYAHMDFVHGASANVKVYQDVLALFSQYLV